MSSAVDTFQFAVGVGLTRENRIARDHVAPRAFEAVAQNDDDPNSLVVLFDFVLVGVFPRESSQRFQDVAFGPVRRKERMTGIGGVVGGSTRRMSFDRTDLNAVFVHRVRLRLQVALAHVQKRAVGMSAGIVSVGIVVFAEEILEIRNVVLFAAERNNENAAVAKMTSAIHLPTNSLIFSRICIVLSESFTNFQKK